MSRTLPGNGSSGSWCSLLMEGAETKPGPQLSLCGPKERRLMGASDVIIQTYVTAGLKWHYTRNKNIYHE